MQLHSWRQNKEDSARGEDDDGDLDAQAPLLGQLPQKDELAKACQRQRGTLRRKREGSPVEGRIESHFC